MTLYPNISSQTNVELLCKMLHCPEDVGGLPEALLQLGSNPAKRGRSQEDRITSLVSQLKLPFHPEIKIAEICARLRDPAKYYVLCSLGTMGPIVWLPQDALEKYIEKHWEILKRRFPLLKRWLVLWISENHGQKLSTDVVSYIKKVSETKKKGSFS